MLRLLVLDNEEIYLRGLESVLSSRSDVKLESMLVNADFTLDEAAGSFDLLVVGISRRGWPHIQPTIVSLRDRSERSLAIISDCSLFRMREILSANFDSLVHRSAATSTLHRAIELTIGGGRYVDEVIGAWLLSETASRWAVFGLTHREREVSDLLMTDLTFTDIAEHLRITRNTVKYHATNAYRKIGVQGRRELRDLGSRLG